MVYKLYFVIILVLSILSAKASPISDESHIEKQLVKKEPQLIQNNKVKQNHGTLTLEEAKDFALCTYDIVNDTNVNRFPKNIKRVICRHAGCSCMDGFKCVQLWRDMEVEYINSNKTDTVNLEYLCVCAQDQQRVRNETTST